MQALVNLVDKLLEGMVVGFDRVDDIVFGIHQRFKARALLDKRDNGLTPLLLHVKQLDGRGLLVYRLQCLGDLFYGLGARESEGVDSDEPLEHVVENRDFARFVDEGCPRQKD